MPLDLVFRFVLLSEYVVLLNVLICFVHAEQNGKPKSRRFWAGEKVLDVGRNYFAAPHNDVKGYCPTA